VAAIASKAHLGRRGVIGTDILLRLAPVGIVVLVVLMGEVAVHAADLLLIAASQLVATASMPLAPARVFLITGWLVVVVVLKVGVAVAPILRLDQQVDQPVNAFLDRAEAGDDSGKVELVDVAEDALHRVDARHTAEVQIVD
jgi:hypothetical protein